MIFRLITTFEKPGVNIIETLWSVKSYYNLADCFLYEGNPYIEGIHENVSDDVSYVEYYIPYHDRNFYELWYDEFKDIFIPYREAAFAELRSMGVEINQYWEELDIAGVGEGSLPIEEFVSRFPPEKLPVRFGPSTAWTGKESPDA
jgi:radical SAM superfamily enzyme YgiQ (UPF0313 family)